MIRGLNLCYLVIIPVIFPFLAFSKMFIDSYIFKVCGRLLNKPAKFLFSVSGDYANAFFIGAAAGFPVGAKTVSEVYLANKNNKSHAVNKNEAERTLAFCNNCSVSFAVSAVGIAVFGSFKTGLALFFIQLFAAIITGIIIRFIFKPEREVFAFSESGKRGGSNYTPREESDFAEILSDSVNAILNVCGTVLFFFIAADITLEYLKFLPFFSSDFFKILIPGIFEISSGINSLVNSDVSAYYKLIFASIILSWSGISVHFQIMSAIKIKEKNVGFSLKPYFTGKIIHAIISIGATLSAVKFAPGLIDLVKINEIAASTAGSPVLNKLAGLGAYTGALALTFIVSLAVMSSAFILVILSGLFRGLCRIYRTRGNP